MEPLVETQKALTDIVGAILQHPTRSVTRRILTVAMGKLGAASATGGITGLVVAFGSASTGTAITSLSGAAATSATLYWIGSLFGLGVLGGTMVLSGAGIFAGVAAIFGGRRYLYGRPRSDGQLEEYERMIVAASVTLLKAIEETEGAPKRQEIKLLADQVLGPLITTIDTHLSRDGSGEGKFRDNLAFLPLRKLRAGRDRLEAIVKEIESGA